MRPPMPAVQLSRRGKIGLGIIGGLIVALVVALSLVSVYTDWLWFGEVGYRGVYATILRTRLILFAIFGLLMGAVLVGNVVLAYRLRPPFRPMSPEQQNLERYRIALEPRKKLALIALGAIAVLAAGSSAQRNWQAWTLWLDGGKFGQQDPQFHRDISFFMWDYPVYRIVLSFLFAAVIFSILLSAGVYYLFGALRLQTPGPKITMSARRHLTILVFLFIVFKALAYWLDRYGLVFSQRGKVTGASYTDVNAALPARTILFGIALVIAVGVLASLWLSSPQIPVISFVALIVTSIVISGIYPALVQQISVKPNASVKEYKYIKRNIDATREAYGIKSAAQGGNVNYVNYAGVPTIKNDQLTAPTNESTIANVRLLDPSVVSPTFTQLQQLQNYYDFPNKLDIDRYTEKGQSSDYVVGVRELAEKNLVANQNQDQTNWINKHTVYTHGFGFVAANADTPLNTNQDFAERNIPPTGFLTIDQPRVYFGELGVDYSVVGANNGSTLESDGKQQTFTYGGLGGVKLSSVLTRAVFALKYGEVNFLLNSTVSAKGARIIFDRDPRQRVLKVAPYLKVDGDPYPAVVGGRIVWILDGYTTMANYPYSETEQLSDLTQNTLTKNGQTARQADTSFNYIRNSVKATVDAYDGTVHLYQWDQQDPVLKAWMHIFPGSIESKSSIPAGILDHIRYPEDLFDIQRALLAKYHVDDPVQFYNAVDQWTVPADPFDEATDQPPYYLLAGQPGKSGGKAEYQLTSPMRVNSKQNLAAYVSVNSENGPDYGKFTVLHLPSGSQTFGPSQIASQVRGATRVSQELNIFDQNGSRVLYGNMLTLPIAKGFLYVLPIYTQAGSVAQPLLRRIAVYYGEKVGYGQTLAGALKNLTQDQVGQGIDDPNITTPRPGSTIPSTPGSSTPGSSAPPTSTPPTPIPSNTPSGPLSTGSPQLDVIIANYSKAYDQLSAAYRSGDPGRIGQAQAALKKYADEYAKARKALTSTPSATR